MQLKPIAAIIVLLLLAASLLVSGCVQTQVTLSPANITNSENQAGSVSTVYPTSGRSQLIQGVTEYDRTRWPFDTYTVNWINNAVAQAIGKENIGEGTRFHTMTVTTTYTHFSTVEAASAYFDLLRPQYPNKNANISASDAAPYYEVTGKLPTVTKQLNNNHYIDNDYSKTLTQQDALITLRSFTFYYPNTPTNQA